MNDTNKQKSARTFLLAGLVAVAVATTVGIAGMNVFAEQGTGTTTIKLVQEEPVSTKLVEKANQV